MEQWPPRQGRPPARPTTTTKDLEGLCQAPFPNVAEAVEPAERLRAAGWEVVPRTVRPGQRLVATVHDPVSYAVIGDIRTTQAYRT